MTVAEKIDKMMFIEGEGGLFRGYCEDIPPQIWHPGSGWEPYIGGPKKRYWGTKITAEEAQELMADLIKEAEDDQRRSHP